MSANRPSIGEKARLLLAILCFAAVIAETPPAQSNDETTFTAPSLHWGYAAYFGTGSYRISDSQSVFVINANAWQRTGELPQLSLTDQTARYRLRLPVTGGLASVDLGDIPEILDPENISLLGAGIAADIDIPLTERWSIRPNTQIAYGRIVGTPDAAWTYRADVRGRYAFALGATQGFLIAAAGSVGYKPDQGPGDDFVFTEFGFEFDIPFRWGGDNGEAYRVLPRAKYTQLPIDMQVRLNTGGVERTTNLVDVGVALAKASGPWRWGFIELERIGLAFSMSPSSDLIGIKLVFQSMYEP